MTGITPERLAGIRERAECPAAKESAFLAADECLHPLIEDDVSDLLAEIERLRGEVDSLQRGSQRNADAHMTTHREMERLRAGIEDIKAKAFDHRQIITEGPLVGRILVAHWCDKALNPTEGEDQ